MGLPRTAFRESDLVGRVVELSLLDGRIAEAADGRGGLVLLGGEPGIGKSRLADEVGRRAQGRGFRVVWGRCRETEGAPPFWPWTQILRGVLAGSDVDVPTDLQPLLDTQSRAPLGADRFQLFDAATTLLVDCARRQPLLLVLDDLHRADHSSLLLLNFLAPAVRDAALLLVGTFRDTEVAPPALFTIISEEAGGVGVDLLTLQGLTVEDTTLLVAGQAPAAALLRPEELQQRCGGNPFFVTELLRLHPGVGESIPSTVSAAISARVAQLPDATRRVLALAAVIGREFEPQLVAVLDELPIDEIDAYLGPAIAAGLVRPTVDVAGGYRFTHVLVREALYDAIPLSQRLALHDRMVRALEGPAGDSLAVPSDLASHAARTLRTPEERQRAVRLAGRAAAAARDGLAHEDAAVWFARALAMGTDAAEERFTLLMELGGCAGRASQMDETRSAYEQAWALAKAQGWSHRLADVALGLGEVIDSAGTVDAGLVRMLEQSLDRVDPADRRTRIRLTARLAVEIYWGPRLPEARRLASDAVAAARRLGDARALAVALAAQQFALRGPDDLAERLRLGQELILQSRALRDVQVELQTRRMLLADQLQADPASADADLQALDALARETRRPLARWYVMVNQCIRASMAGRHDQALALVDETEAFGRRIGARPAGMYGVVQRFFLRRESGLGAESEDELRGVIPEYPRLATLRCVLAVLLSEAGRRDESGALLGELVADECSAIPSDALWLSSLAMLAITAARLEQPREAAIVHRLLEPHAGKVVLQGLAVWWGGVDHYLGLTATTLERWDEAEEALQSALRLHEAWAAVPFVRASLDGLAAMLRRRGGPGDRLRASHLADRGFIELTGREREILRLLASGAPNKQIARQLNISIHTVERHVANVYAKIGARNRSEATAFALQTEG